MTTFTLHELTSFSERESGTKPILESDDSMASSPPPATDSSALVHDALKQSILLVYDDTSLNADGKLAKIKALLKFKDKASATLGPPKKGGSTPRKAVTEEADDDATVSEALELTPEVDSTLLEEHFDDMRISISPRVNY